MSKKCIVINLFGAPGAGKSTGAAYVYSRLKMLGLNVELVREYAKDKVWEENFTPLEPDNQAYVFGKQSYRLNTVAKGVDIIVTDAPLIHSILYNQSDLLGDTFNQTVLQYAEKFDNLNYLVIRNKPYNPKGRHQSKKESDAMVDQFQNLFQKYDIPYEYIKGDIAGYDSIVADVWKKYTKDTMTTYKQANQLDLVDAYVKLNFSNQPVIVVYTNEASAGEIKVLEELFNNDKKFPGFYEYLFIPVESEENGIQTINKLNLTVPAYLYDAQGTIIHENR